MSRVTARSDEREQDTRRSLREAPSAQYAPAERESAARILVSICQDWPDSNARAVVLQAAEGLRNPHKDLADIVARAWASYRVGGAA